MMELTTNLENISTDTSIKWEYNFIDEDETPTKISFVLNYIDYDSIEKIPTKLEEGDYTLNFKVQDSKGLWSNEIVNTFNVYKKEIMNENIYIRSGNGYGGYNPIFGYFDKKGDFVITNNTVYNTRYNNPAFYIQYNEKMDRGMLSNLYRNDNDYKYLL